MLKNNGHGSPDTNRIMVEKKPIARPAAPKKRKRSFFWLFALLFLLVLGGATAFIFVRREQAHSSLVSNTKEMTGVPTVFVLHPERGSSDVHLVLPGTVQAEMESSVYAQVSGYVKRWLVDIGAPVKAGQLLAEIETPVTDQQLKQSSATPWHGDIHTNLNSGTATTAARYNDLLKTSAVSQQDVDAQNAGVAVQDANLAAAQANVQGLEQTEAFKEVKAPFDGIVTARKIDVGDLVSATGASSSQGGAPSPMGTPSQELFRVAQTKTLRVYVNIPENYSDEIVPGITATLELASSPNQKVTGKLTMAIQGD